MSRLPIPGQDDGTWGGILNDFLSVELNADGTLKQAGNIADAQTKADSAVQSVNGKTGTSVTLAAGDVSAVATSQIGANSGVASLDSGGKVPAGELPSSVVNANSAGNNLVPIANGSGGYAWGSQNGAYVAIDTLVYNVLNHGVVGDGATDNTTALQTLLNTIAATTNGGIAYFPPGQYVINASGSTLYIGNNTTLMGAGQGVSVLLSQPSAPSSPSQAIGNGNVWTVTNSHITICDLTLDRTNANAEHGMLFNGVSYLTIERVEVRGSGNSSNVSGAIAVSGVMPGGYAGSLSLSSDVRIANCRFYQSNNFGVQLSNVTDASVVGNVFDDCYREAVGVEPESGCVATNVSITGNSFTVNTIPSGGSATGAIVITESSGGTVANVTATGNTITNLNAQSTNGNPGITVLTATSTAKGVVLIGNTISGMNGQGISCGSASFGSTGVMIVGNTVLNCNAGNGQSTFAGAGISLRQARYCNISGNYIKGTHHTASIYESQSGVGPNQLVNNFLQDTTSLVLLAGSGTTTSGNTCASENSATRIAKSANYTMNAWDPPIIAYTSTSSAFTVTLPAANAVSVGSKWSVVDESNAAGTNHITIARAGADTFTDASTSKSISANNGELSFYSTGSAWQVIS